MHKKEKNWKQTLDPNLEISITFDSRKTHRMENKKKKKSPKFEKIRSGLFNE